MDTVPRTKIMLNSLTKLDMFKTSDQHLEFVPACTQEKRSRQPYIS